LRTGALGRPLALEDDDELFARLHAVISRPTLFA